MTNKDVGAKIERLTDAGEESELTRYLKRPTVLENIEEILRKDNCKLIKEAAKKFGEDSHLVKQMQTLADIELVTETEEAICANRDETKLSREVGTWQRFYEEENRERNGGRGY